MEATLKLFNALPIATKEKKTNQAIMRKTIKLGFIFSPEVIANYSNYDELIRMVEKTVGLTGEKLNAAFHKSWNKIKEADLEDLVVEQIAHYLTTYGKEYSEEYLEEKGLQWGVEDLSEKVSRLKDIEIDKIEDKGYVYIPKEKLSIPKIKIDDIKLVVIRGYTKSELKEKLLGLLISGIALAEATIKDVLEVAIFMELQEKEVAGLKNKEVRAALYDYLELFPENPTEFLRFVIYKTTNKTLIIKSPDLIRDIKSKDNLAALKLLNKYSRKHGLQRLAEIFYRFKPIFLAFRTNKELKVLINKIRKLAVGHHKPMPEDYLNAVTAKIKSGVVIDPVRLGEELDKVNTFRKIRLAYALKFRTLDIESNLYRIRNGKAFATETSTYHPGQKAKAKKVLDTVISSIIRDVSKNVRGKSVYIPDYINYALPATEKQFTGHFPSGTYIVVPKDMVFGIHWDNVGEERIDLDLSLLSPVTGKIGWDANYRTEEKTILFSGDMTDATKPDGASELFYVQRQTELSLIVFLNYYNFMDGLEVPFKIIVAQEKVRNLGHNYMINPNNVLAMVNSSINQKQKILGLLVSTSNDNRFYFAETNIGRSITSHDSPFAEHSRRYLFEFYQNAIGLREILEMAEAILVKEKEQAEVDLSPESLEKDTILRLLFKKEC